MFLHFFRALPFPVCFTAEQSTVEASLFVIYASDRQTKIAQMLNKNDKTTENRSDFEPYWSFSKKTERVFRFLDQILNLYKLLHNYVATLF